MQTPFDKKTERKILIPTTIFALCGFLGIDIHLASLPAIMQYMHTDRSHIQQSISIFLLGMSISMIFYGPLSDKYGRKPNIIFGLILASLGSFASCFTHTIGFFLISRLLQGIGCGVCSGLGRVVFSDVLLGERFAIVGSQFAMLISLSPIFAPMIGGYVQHYFGWQANFALLGSILLFSAGLYGFLTPETNIHKHLFTFKFNTVLNHYYDFLKNPIFLLSTILSGIVIAITMVYATLSPFIFQVEFHMTPVVYGWITGILGSSGLIGRFIIPTMINKYSRNKHMLICSNIFLAMSFLLLIFETFSYVDVIILSIIVFFCIFSQTALAPVLVSYAMEIFPTRRGIASSLFGSGQILISFFISSISGYLPIHGTSVLAISYFFMSLLIFFGARKLKHFLLKH